MVSRRLEKLEKDYRTECYSIVCFNIHFADKLRHQGATHLHCFKNRVSVVISHKCAIVLRKTEDKREAVHTGHILDHTDVQALRCSCVVVHWNGSQRARRTYRALPPPLPPPGTFHYGPKMYLRVSRTQSRLFPGQSLGCTGVIALCARVPSWVQSVADWAQVTNASFKSLVHYCFVT